ncbi:MAG: zinc-ribbon domain-containing protein, partial [bacterium]|nr:zinc-ribbon domain-containing protein [bacterium]
FCSNCGKKISEGNKFCEYCGEKICMEKKVNHTIKHCPFCKKEVDISNEECPNCKRILVEKIRQNEKYTADTPEFNNQKKESIVSKLIGLGRRINYSKLIFNKYVAILFGVIFLVWILSGDDSSYNSGSTKAPLPPPTTQVSNDVVEFTPTTPAISLANGTILKKNSTYLQGYGELQIKNGTNLDAVAKLIQGGTSVLTVYIKANNTYTMLDISDGIYWLAFAQGLDWDSVTQKFRRDTQYSVFEDTFDFTTTYSQSTIFEVTLNPVIGGTAETNDIPGSQFDQY